MIEKSVLIVTPFSDFGDLVSESVRKNHPWKTKSVSTVKALTDCINNNDCLDYALLDMELGFEKVRKSVFIIRDTFPCAEMILISKKELPHEAEELRPWRLLSKPFVEKDLMEIFNRPGDININHVIDGKFSDPVENEIPTWATDKDVIKNILEYTIAKLDVQEAIIYADNNVLAYTNNIQGDDITDCACIVRKYMDVTGKTELIKQIHLSSNNYLLHTTILAVGIILALLYSPDTPYNVIRNQTKYLATQIVSPQLSGNEPHSLPASIITIKGNKSSQTQINEIVVEPLNNPQAKSLHPRPAMKFKRIKIGTDEKGEVGDPGGTSSLEFYDESDPGEETETPLEIDPAELESLWKFSIPEPDTMPPSTHSVIHASIPDPEPESELENQFDFVAPLDNRNRPAQKLSNVNAKVEITQEPFHQQSQSSSRVNYACLLIPRIKSNYLVKELARYINEEIPTIFLAYGWRLEGLIIEKQYMQWNVLIPSTFAPSYHINIVRKESSRMILGNFGRLNKDGLIKDFWAPGFLLESGKQPISDQEIYEFILSNRLQYYPNEKIYRFPDANLFTNN